MATEVQVYVDPDATGAKDGTSEADAYDALATAVNTEGKNIRASTGSDEKFTFLCFSSGGTFDTTFARLSTDDGWLTEWPNNYVEVRGLDFPADGIRDDAKYLLHNNDASIAALELEITACLVKNIQVLVTQTGTNIRYGIDTDPGAPVGQINLIDGCIFTGVCSGTFHGHGVFSGSNKDLRVFNSTFLDFKSGSSTNMSAIYAAQGVVRGWNNTIWNAGVGLKRTGAGLQFAKNTIIGGDITSLVSSGIPLDYCMSAAGIGTNAQTPSGGDFDNEVTDGDNGDFTLVAGGNAIGNAITDPGAGLFSDDIRRITRTVPWDIGAFKEGAAPAMGGNALFLGTNF